MRLLLLLIALVTPFVSGAQAEDVPRVEPGDCIYKADGALKTTCGYLVVPENRHNPQGRVIKLPFIYVESNNPAKKTGSRAVYRRWPRCQFAASGHFHFPQVPAA